MGWLKYSPSDFLFTAKMPKLITHDKRLGLKSNVKADLATYFDLMRPLQQRRRPLHTQRRFCKSHRGGVLKKLEHIPTSANIYPTLSHTYLEEFLARINGGA